MAGFRSVQLQFHHLIPQRVGKMRITDVSMLPTRLTSIKCWLFSNFISHFAVLCCWSVALSLLCQVKNGMELWENLIIMFPQLDKRKKSIQNWNSSFCIVVIAQICSRLFAVFWKLFRGKKLSQNWVDIESNRNSPNLISILCLHWNVGSFRLRNCCCLPSKNGWWGQTEAFQISHKPFRIEFWLKLSGAYSIFVVVSIWWVFRSVQMRGKLRYFSFILKKKNSFENCYNFLISISWHTLSHWTIQSHDEPLLHHLCDSRWQRLKFLHNDDLSTATQMHPYAHKFYQWKSCQKWAARSDSTTRPRINLSNSNSIKFMAKYRYHDYEYFTLREWKNIKISADSVDFDLNKFVFRLIAHLIRKYSENSLKFNFYQN